MGALKSLKAVNFFFKEATVQGLKSNHGVPHYVYLRHHPIDRNSFHRTVDPPKVIRGAIIGKPCMRDVSGKWSIACKALKAIVIRISVVLLVV